MVNLFKAGSLKLIFICLVAPFIDNKMKRKFAVMEGEHVELVCPVGGIPSPNISWLATLGRNTESDAQTIKTGEVVSFFKFSITNYKQNNYS
jgi:hypothetical protein